MQANLPMEPAKARGPTTLLQKMQEVADRLSTHAKVEIYQVLEGVAPSGELSSLHRLDPLISDIVQQLSESFKQAFTKLLLPEASKLMGARAAASAPWAAGQALQTQGPDALTSASKEQTHLENDILALGLVPGTGQPLRPDQGPPQDAASAAASSLLLGTAATSSQTHMQHNLSPAPPTSVGGAGTSGGTAAASHPLESRFAFANDAHRSIPLSPLLGRDSSYGGGTVATIATTDLGPVADSLHFLGLGESGTGMAFASGSETNGLANSFMLSASLTGSLGSGGGGIGGGRSTPGTGNGYTPAASPSPGTVSRQLGALSLGGTPVSRGGVGAVRTTASSVSPPSPNPSTPSPYQALPLTIRPGSSLDPGLATPPVSLSGTEPLRGNSHALHLQVSPQHHQQKNRLSGAGDASPLIPVGGSNDGGATRTVPVPLFGGAPGPSPAGPSHQHQQLRQQQPLPTGNGISGSVGEAGTRSSGNGGMAIGQQQQQQLMQQQLQQQLHQQLQPQPQLMHQQHSNTDIGDYQRQQYALVQQQHLMQQQQSLTGQYDGSSFKPAPVLRTALASVPDGPRASYDGRTPSSSFAVSNPGEMPYGMQSIYCANGANSISFQTAGAFGERFASPGPVAFGASGGGGITPGRSGFGGVGGSASPEYGMYSLAPLGPAGLGSGGGTGILMDMMRAGSSSGGGGAAASGLIQPGSGSAGAMGIGYGNGAQSGNGRTGGSPIMTRAAPSAVTTATSGTVANRPSRSGTASATSAVDSRSSSFSTGAQMVPHRGSGNGGGTAMTQQPYTPQQPSPPASDASGPSSAASVSTVGIGAGGGVAKGSAVAALATTAASGGGNDGASCLSMAAKLQQIASKPVPSPVGSGRGKSGSSSSGGGSSGGGGPKAPADMPGRFRCLPPPVQARIHTLTRENHVVLLKDFDEKVLSKMTLLVDKFGAAECLAMLDRIEEVLKGKAGRLANGPGYLDVSVSTRLDELKQRASGQVTAPEDYARSTLHSRIYAELRDLISRHGFLQWHHFDQGIINMLKKMPNATALERLNELAYHSFKNVDNPKSCIVSIFTTKPKYVSGN